MPTSTAWRRGAPNFPPRNTSPERPSDHDIEPISPTPHFASPSATSPPFSSYHPAGTHPLNGLGLSHAGHVSKNEQHPELGIDSNGVARLHSRATTVIDRDDRNASRSRTWNQPNSLHARDHHLSRARNHTRSGSTIDDLASAAIANCPPFTNGNPRPSALNGSPVPTRPSTSHVSPTDFRDNYEPPAKRIKSERIPALEWAVHSSRPVTSYEPSQQSPRGTTAEDAALLLGLKQEVNFSKQITPRLNQAQLHRPNTREGYSFDDIIADRMSTTNQQSHSPEGMHLDQSEVAHQQRPQQETEGIQAHPSGASLGSFGTSPGHGAARMIAPEPSSEILSVKKARRLKPEQLQAEVCAQCGKQEQKIADDEESISWIQCNGCNRWFHSMCAGIMGKAEARAVDKFICKACEPVHGETTYVRTSSRARTAIDYAGLNQGVIKSSVETSLHHYIQPFRTNKFKIQPDDFARIRPELLTAEFFQSFDNMKRPFVVPAAWNPRFGVERDSESLDDEQLATYTHLDGEGSQAGEENFMPAEQQSEEVIDCDQDLLDMVMPRNLTVRKVSDLVGPDCVLPGVIDVKSQETKGVWTLGKWADYYEEPSEKPVRNVISLEVSETPLGRVLRRPKVVRELDLEDHVWPDDEYPDKKKKSVKFYCLMSVADSYTDFHIDFGGSSVYYHILKGTKTFFFIPPEDKYLKKYEEWCNSNVQNDTWLPDLCGGNVTRVDLHEGDTAFIPAGWIHSVWTPEDSLVIGGNFLTHVDYELQLKVATVEKNTHVAISFRYPFFQKVMWYALIKYLTDDPVPEDVLDDFKEDRDFIYLRANPVWFEVDYLLSDGEPGSPAFNYRYYSKSEMKGLPALRDYLYRTARIATDLPVDNITKKAIDAVKKSVPREHGDPLALIKTFAIWCAWKIGGVKAPAWVHTDELEGSEYERKMKKVKPVNHRIPGERTSSRRIAQQHQSQHEQSPKESPGPELEIQQQQSPDDWRSREPTFPSVVTPYKPGESAAGVNSDATKKHKPASTKPTTTRQACDACRKRRVKCRHKEASLPATWKSTSPRSVSPVDSFIPPANGALFDMGHSLESSTDASNLSLAQAALASLETPAVNQTYHLMSDQSPPLNKKSRSKACEECRKSKRRCVHDENGKIDPAKAAEPTKPRGSTSSKRPSRPIEDDLQLNRNRIDSASSNRHVDFDVMSNSGPHTGPSAPSASSQDHRTETVNSANRDAMQIDSMTERLSTSGSTAIKQEPEHTIPNLLHEPTIEIGTGFAVPEHAIDDSEPRSVHTTFPSVSPISQRQSSRQPKQVERFVTDHRRTPSKPTSTSGRRGSSAISTHTLQNSVKTRRSSSNTSDTVHGMINPIDFSKTHSSTDAIRPGSRGRESTAESELTADEKLARELQAEEHGLRRRPSMMRV